MRISSSMIWDSGVATINSQSAALLHLQQQVSSGRRIVTPADDPVAAARALDVTQARDVNAQFKINQNNAFASLGMEETQLTGMGELLTRVKELTVKAGNSALGASDRQAIATELRGRFDELLGLANATDGAGQYLFSGFMGSTKPFGGSVDQLNLATGNEITYQGDDGQRQLQVSASRQISITDSGNDVFRRVPNGNGYFATAYAAANTGTGIIDGGSITDPAKWNSAANGKNLEVRFWKDTAGTVGAPNTTYYDLVDATSGNSLYTNTASTTGAGGTFTGHVYTSNQPIGFGGLAAPFGDLGATVTISGEPASGDAFTLKASSSQSIFKTLANLIGTLERGTTGPASNARYSNDIGFALTNIDQASDHLLTVRAAIGSRMNELDALGSLNTDLDLQYQQTLSNLQDLDYAKAISDLSRKQLDLEAAQKSFTKVAQLSLFNFL